MANIRKISELAGVSVATVSRVLNHPETVSEETRNRILKVIEEVNYVPNSIARSLSTNRTSTIGLIIPNILNPLYPSIAKGVEDVFYKKGYNILLSNTENDAKREKDSIEMLLSKKVDGLIICSSILERADFDTIIRQKVPLVLLGDYIEDADINVVYTDYLLGAYMATNHLIKTGCKTIAHISGPMNRKPSVEKLEGYKKALLEAGYKYDEEYVIEGDNQIGGGHLALKKILKKKGKPDAIFVANDLMALGVIEAIKVSGYAVPDDIAVVGFDDIDVASLIEPKLTTVTHPVYRMGLTAARLLLDNITNEEEDCFKQKIFIQPMLKVRKSCGYDNRIEEIFS
ncbi:LacI family DNA-binding transcriptional regulator [Proteiniborus sp. MB09-C3]|uniref:LacI family DNA-binding transcriptional regulator n=1 Tax=Proteiniborus sp. MB09-C3 TaxID=3050072 RepID=UPI0025562F0B|nr:LacI family DNA-binding transcriptional regulator [Proteiniborus sp. MB09-C3]WIV11683.1 LacI family DNA-binding transcriptional regulator [Proteiniborus sp. MB09-C3]